MFDLTPLSGTSRILRLQAHTTYSLSDLASLQMTFFVRSLFLSNLPYIDSYSGVEGRHIYIINPDPRAEENYQFVLSRGFATLLKEPFAEGHIELMKGERSPP